MLKEPTYKDPSNEAPSCIANVIEVGRQARARLRIIEKERMALSFHGVFKFMKQSKTKMVSRVVTFLVPGLRFLATDLNNGLPFTV